MVADARDILTLAEGKRALRIATTDTTQDDELELYITAASRAMDQHFGNTVQLAVTDELHDGLNRSGWGYRDVIVLNHRPVISVASVVEYRNGNPTTLSPETVTDQPGDAFLVARYDPDPTLYNGFVRRRGSGYGQHYEPGRSNIAATYVAGRVSSSTDVDRRFKRACGMVLANLWREREPGVVEQDEFMVPHQAFPGFAIPQAARMLLAEEWGQHQGTPV
jgi:hypothetical protein